MSLIYIVQPETAKGIAGLGPLVLREQLCAAGHEAKCVKFDAPDDQSGLFDGGKIRSNDGSTLRRPDAWFVSTVYAREWPRIPAMFKAMGLSPLSRDRKETDPLVAFGGQAVSAPAPIEPFADVVALGDGDVSGVALASMLGGGKASAIDFAAGSVGLYVPGVSKTLVRADSCDDFPTYPVSPSDSKSVTVEVARGCRYSCPYCSIGWMGGRYREARRENVVDAICRTSSRKINLYAPDFASLSWSTEADDLLRKRGMSHAGKDVRPSTMIKDLRSGVRPRMVSIGAEGVSLRLRRALKREPLEEDLEELLSLSVGVESIKLYLIIGLPGETDSDRAEFHELVRRIRRHINGMIYVTMTHFQAVPHTPMQYACNLYDDAAAGWAREFTDYLKITNQRVSKGKRIMTSTVKGRELHEHESWLQKSGQEAAEYIMQTKLAWTRDGRWRELVGRLGLPGPDQVLAAWNPGEIKPWSHVKAGPDPEVAWRAYQKRLGDPPQETWTVWGGLQGKDEKMQQSTQGMLF